MKISWKQNLTACQIQEIARFLLRWSGDQSFEMSHALCLEPSEVSTAILWSKWILANQQANELRARYDPFKIFSQAGSFVDECYNTVLKQLALYSNFKKPQGFYPEISFYFVYKTRLSLLVRSNYGLEFCQN